MTKRQPRMRLVSNLNGALYECRDCGSPNALTGSCRGCGVPSVVEDRPTRRHARPPADWVLTLAHNLAIVGALFASFRAGDNFGFHMGGDGSFDALDQCTCQWSPGSGEPYRPRHRCEHDNDVFDYEDRREPDLDPDEVQ